ncbi:FHA domain-containing protein [Bariatricus sp. SGI.154]|uniref:FHA domain-containing protein n=1 Tax=Bariatricus sp. SGI.154 TaxID=3420549 RepID=UPI003D025758
MNQKNVWRYGLSIAGIVGLASLWLPICQAQGASYNMPMLLQLRKSVGMIYCILLVAVILMSLFGTLIITLWENEAACLTSGVCRIASAVLLLIIKMALLGKYTGIPDSGLLKGAGIGFWIFLLIHLLSGAVGILLSREGGADAVKKEKRKPENQPVPDTVEEPEGRSGIIAILEGIYKGETLPMEDMQALVVGRDASQCNLVIEGEKVSRKHCSITYCARTGGYLLCDYSSNGTYYRNGQRLPKHMNIELTKGTEVYLGDKRNILRMGG